MPASADAAIAALNGVVIDGHRMAVEKEDVDKAKRKKSEKEAVELFNEIRSRSYMQQPTA